MDGLDPVSQGLFFAANQATSAQAAFQAKKQQEAGSVKKSSFQNAMEKAQQEKEFLAEGLPVELAGMTEEEAVIYLKDQADIAADKLRSEMLPANFAAYREKVSQFMKYIVKNNFEVTVKKRPGLNRKGKPFAPQMQVKIINQKLDEMAEWLLSSHQDTLKLLAKVDEINGMLVDLMAR